MIRSFRFFMLINVCAIAASCGSQVGTENITPATLQTIAVTPVNPSIAKGLTNQFIATGTYSDGTSADISAKVLWSSDRTTVATVNSSGLASGSGAGATMITAASGAISGSTTLTVTAAVLQSITVTPSNPSIALGRTQQFTATGSYTDGTSADISASVLWSSDRTIVATVNSTGLATGVGIGAATITATSGAMSGSTTLTVTAATLQSIAVTPPNPSITLGRTQQFTAMGTYPDGIFDITEQVTWTSGTTTVATMNSTGLATGAGIGMATITATSGAIAGSTALTVLGMSFSDDYSGGLSAWTQTDGTWSVVGGYIQGSPSGQSVNIYYNTPTSTTSQWIQARFSNMHDSDTMGMILWASSNLLYASQLYCLYSAGTFFVGYNDLEGIDHNYSPACIYSLANDHYVGFEVSGTPSSVTMTIYDNGTSPAPRPWSSPICTWTNLDASEYTYGKYVGMWVYHVQSDYSYDVFGPVNGGDQ